MAVSSLSKSRYVAGLQCHRQLWWRVHEYDAPELVPDEKQQAIFDQGHLVGERARTLFPGGVLIDLPFEQKRDRIEATRLALENGARILYEGSFQAGGAYASVDILERTDEGFIVIEVKSSTRVKIEYINDVALQVYALRRSGLPVIRAEVMHLNRECVYPDLSNLFVREDVTAQVEAVLLGVPEKLEKQLAMLNGPLPLVATGEHCSRPYKCPFWDRCWSGQPEYDVSTLYYGADKAHRLRAEGYLTLRDLPPDFPLTPIQARQVESVRRGSVIVDARLGMALDRIEGPVAYLDFETISPAIPVWNGCRPYDRVPVQFSCDVIHENAPIEHFEWLADGPRDPRPEVARRVVDSCARARTVIAYNSAFEKECLRTLAAAAPQYKDQLDAISAKLFDALPLVREHVYHPRFAGSFSLKSVYPALVEQNGYESLEIADGELASAKLMGLLLGHQMLGELEREPLREKLRSYCALDTQALAQLVHRLRELISVRLVPEPR